MKTASAHDTNPKDAAGRSRPPLHLVPPVLLAYVAAVQGHGAAKYGAYNWRSSRVAASVYMSAAMRHLLRWWDGEELDADSGLPHLAHVAACMGILLDAQSLGLLVDDRPPQGRASQVLQQLTEWGLARSRSAPYTEEEAKHVGLGHTTTVKCTGR